MPLRPWRKTVIFFVLFFAIYTNLLIPLPFVAYSPGMATDAAPFVTVGAEGDATREGQFMITTIRMSYRLNGLQLLKGILDPETEIYRKSEVFRADETLEEFHQRQKYNMIRSQSAAVMAAYEELGIPYRMESDGVIVTHVFKGMPAENVLKAGDVIEKAEGRKIRTIEEFQRLLEQKEAGDRFAVTLLRDGRTRTAEVEIGALEEDGETKKAIGVSLTEVLEVKPHDPAYEVSFAEQDIGGPSAGLIFALQILDSFLEEDLTKGYRIAGTGEISPDGKVGIIGGVEHKVAGAVKQNADFFFAPLENAEQARKKAEKLDRGLQVVAVGTLREALDYLRNLTPADAAD